MSTMKFECVHTDLQGDERSKVTMTFDGDCDLYEVLDNFKFFLQGCSFNINGDLVLEEPEKI